MNHPLATYLHDHLAGATFAIETLEALREQHPETSNGKVAAELLLEVGADRALLEQLATQVQGQANGFKEAVAWLTEKASRLKLRRQTEGSLGLFETWEALCLGILGKEALWTALQSLSPQDPRIQALDYPHLIARAQEQHRRAEAQRITLSITTFLDPISRARP